MGLPRPDSPIPELLKSGGGPGLKYAKSFLLLRMLVGIVGIALPFVVVLGKRVLFGGEWLGSSLSGYYHTGVRDIFVGGLCAIAMFLLTYMAFHNVLDNVFSIVAGFAALGVALFPTGGPSPLTPLQEKLGESTVSRIHVTCAIVFLLSLAIISFLFANRENEKKHPGWRRVIWPLVHVVCGVVIIAALLFVGFTKLRHWHDGHSILYGEAVAAVAFGVSWLTKGANLKVLLKNSSPPSSTPDDSAKAAVALAA